MQSSCSGMRENAEWKERKNSNRIPTSLKIKFMQMKDYIACSLMKFQTEHSHFKTRHKKKIVKMIGKKAHTRNEITNAKANERERETECEKENESDGEQQIVVLKM